MIRNKLQADLPDLKVFLLELNLQALEENQYTSPSTPAEIVVVDILGVFKADFQSDVFLFSLSSLSILFLFRFSISFSHLDHFKLKFYWSDRSKVAVNSKLNSRDFLWFWGILLIWGVLRGQWF
jgi:hypothetical protein